MGYQREDPLWSDAGFGKKAADLFSGSPRCLWNRKKRKLFERGNRVLKSENSLGKAGFWKKMETNQRVGFFYGKIVPSSSASPEKYQICPGYLLANCFM